LSAIWRPYGIGLRLSEQAARELSEPPTLLAFQQWLDKNQCYVFTINGFPYGKFHGTRVKEKVYAPDWTSRDRLDYTKLLFDLLAQIVPEGVEGSVSTLPGSFKEFITGEEQVKSMRSNLWECVQHIAQLSERSGRKLHLGLEPEPLCYLETSAEVALFFQQMLAERPYDDRLLEHLGVNYDTCHLALQFEEPKQAIKNLRQNNIKISKFHLSSALKVRPTPEVRQALTSFADDTYFHQVIERQPDGSLRRYRDLGPALAQASLSNNPQPGDWRIHFHIPLHSPVTQFFDNTTSHIIGVMEILSVYPDLCSHLEMETYTWEVMPGEMKNRSVVDQLVSEYQWTLQQLAEFGFLPVA